MNENHFELKPYLPLTIFMMTISSIGGYLVLFIGLMNKVIHRHKLHSQYMLGSLMAWMLLSCLWTSQPSLTIALHDAMKYVSKFLLFMSLVPLLKYLNHQHLHQYWFWSLFTTICVCMLGLTSHRFFYDIPLSALSALIALDLILFQRPHYILKVGFILMYLLFFNYQRTGVLMFIIGLIFLLCNYIDKKKYKYFFGLLSVLMLLGITPLGSKFMIGIKEIFYSQGVHYQIHTSMGIRRYFFEKSLVAILSHPIVGYGAGSQHVVLMGILEPRFAIDHTHMLYTQITIQYGLIGLGLFTSWMISLFLFACRCDKRSRVNIHLVLLLLLVYGVFDAPLYTLKAGFIMMFWLAQSIAFSKPEPLHMNQ